MKVTMTIGDQLANTLSYEDYVSEDKHLQQISELDTYVKLLELYNHVSMCINDHQKGLCSEGKR